MALEDLPLIGEGLFLAAHVAIARADVDEAVSLFSAAAELAQHLRWSSCQAAAYVLQKHGHLREALALADQLVAEGLNDFELAHLAWLRGELLLQLDEPGEALAAFDAARRPVPTPTNGHFFIVSGPRL